MSKIKIKRNKVDESKFGPVILLSNIPALIIGVVFLVMGFKQGYVIYWALGLACFGLIIFDVVRYLIKRKRAKKEDTQNT